MKTTTFKNVWVPTTNNARVIGTNGRNQRWYIDCESRQGAHQLCKLVMRSKGKVELASWAPFTKDMLAETKQYVSRREYA
jgi:hypothetical protein